MTDIASRPLIIRTFMTHDMRDEDIEALSTGREDEFARILSAVARSRGASPGALQHVIVYGSRGFGKSFMTRRVQIAVGGMESDLGPVVYVLLPEEQHNLQRSPHALLDTIALRLNDIASNADEAFEAALFQWPKPGEEAKRWDQAAMRLEHAVDNVLPGGKGLVIAVVENFDVLLDTLFKNEEDEQRLRLWLDRRKNRVMLFATATGTVDLDYERPLFKALEPVRLSPWTAADCIAYFNRHREREGRPPLDGEQEAKARAIADFIGGTPRLAQLLAEVLDTQDALTVAETMSALADRLAEYYKHRIEDLPPLGRGLLDALIRGGEPASQTELAARVGAGGQSDIARTMSDLQHADIIRGRPAPGGRETLYSVTDRVFVHYYRLRQGSRAARATPLATILDFLKSFYSRDEQRAQALRHLDAGRPAEAGLFSSLALEGEHREENYYSRGFAYRLERYLDAASDALGADAATVVALLVSNPAEAYEYCRRAVGNKPAAEAILSVVRAQALYRLGHPANTVAELRKSTALVDADARIIAASELSIYLSYAVRDFTAAAQAGLAVQNQLPEARSSRVRLRGLLSLSWSLDILKRNEEALEAYRHTVALAVQIGETLEEIPALRRLASSLTGLGHHEEALDAATRAVKLAAQIGDKRTEAESLANQAFSLGQLGRHEEAINVASRAADRAAQIGDKRQEAESLRHQFFSLGQLGRHEKAVDVARRAAECASQIGDKREEAISLRNQAFSLGQLGHHGEAVDAAIRAATLAVQIGDKRTEAESLRHQAFSLGRLGRHEEAIDVAIRAAERAAQIGEKREEAISLRHQSYSLEQLGRREEALDVASRATEVAAQTGDKREEASALRRHAFALGQVGRHQEAIDVASRAAETAILIGDKVEEAEALRHRAYSLQQLGRRHDAWESLGPVLKLRHIDDFEFTWAVMDAVLLAAHLPHREIVALYAEWIEAWRETVTNEGLPDPTMFVSKIFTAAARSAAFDELDAMLRKEGDWLANNATRVWFSDDDGAVIGRIAESHSRARAYEAAARLLPRIKTFLEKLPRENRSAAWLTPLISGFAAACCDTGLLRDVATLMTEDLAPDAPESGRLLRALADVDEADDAERILARMDPDMATLIRRLRNLPDPPPLKPKRAKGRRRKPI